MKKLKKFFTQLFCAHAWNIGLYELPAGGIAQAWHCAKCGKRKIKRFHLWGGIK